MVNGTGALPLGKRYLARLVGTDPDRVDRGGDRDLVESRRAVLAAALAAVAVELTLRAGGYPAPAGVPTAAAAGVGAGLVADGGPSEAVAGLLAGSVVVLAGVALAALTGVAPPGLALAPNAPFVWFTHLVVLPLSLVVAAVAATLTAAVGGRGGGDRPAPR
jgi:hypothetical protein